jgi:beta-glucanase (GH16 family)
VGAGFSPTILLWPKDDNWPQGGEIDLLESPHGTRTHAIAVVHNLTTSNMKSQGLAGNQSDWHTYAVDWLPNRITFYIDDVEQWTVTDPRLIPTSTPMHLALQNDAGCGWIECPNKSTPPVTQMQVDWIKVYALPKS